MHTTINVPPDALFPSHAPSTFLSQVQHRLPLHDDVDADRAGVLPAAGLGGEDCPRRHSPTRFLRDDDAFIRVRRRKKTPDSNRKYLG